MKLLNPVNVDFNSIKNIIFDWGGVITNIDYQKTVDAFAALGIDNFRVYYSQLHQNDLFIQYETGKITTEVLRQQLQKDLKPGTTDQQIDEAWCAMLLDTPLKNLEMLKAFSKKFRIFLLSNTNEIHADYYNAFLKETTGIDYPALFEKVYYSHVIGRRKPNADIFELVLSDNKLLAHETLFIDDTEMHVDTASDFSINAFYLNNGLSLQDIFNAWQGLK
jgi:putative hydrolase of the HAD superfamily